MDFGGAAGGLHTLRGKMDDFCGHFCPLCCLFPSFIRLDGLVE